MGDVFRLRLYRIFTKKMLAYDYNKLRDLLRHMLLHQIFVDGVFHADLHQGNVLVIPDGKIVMIDRGNVGTLNREQIEGAKILLKGLSLREKDSIKQGVDRIFLNAQYPPGVQPTSSSITLTDIQDVLDKGYDLKMTMNMISVRAVQGAKNTPGGKNFSTFLKAFTQAMYLFPTDLTNGMGTLQVIAQYVSMSEEDARRAAQEQAKYFVVKDVEANTGEGDSRQGDIVQIVKRIFYQKTGQSFMHSLWQPFVFRMMSIPIKKATAKATSMKGNMMTIIRVYGRQVIEENIDEFVKRQDSGIGDVMRDVISVPYAEKFATVYVERGMKEHFLGRMSAPVAVPLFKGALALARPFTKIYVEAAKEWIDTTGKQYIASIAPQMSVREGVELLSQVFVEDFSDIKRKFDGGRPKDRVESASVIPEVSQETSAAEGGVKNDDHAMKSDVEVVSEKQNPGGIDLNLDLLKLEVQGQADNFNLTGNEKGFEYVHIDNGLFPVIINITPIENLSAVFKSGNAPEQTLVAVH